MYQLLIRMTALGFLMFPDPILAKADANPNLNQTLAQSQEQSPEALSEIPWTKIIPPQTQVIFFGELHNEVAPKRFMIQHLPFFRKIGFDHLALEMLEQGDQPALDRFRRGEDPIQIIEELLLRTWGFLPREYSRMLVAARSLGYELTALDVRPQQGGSDDAVMATRDFAMAKRIKEGIRHQPLSRWLVFVGANHARRPRPQPMQPFWQSELLTQDGIATLSLRFEDTKLTSPLRKHLELEGRSTQATWISSQEMKDLDPTNSLFFDGTLFIDGSR